MGRIYFLKTPEKKTIFPATRAEGVLYEDTTVGKTLDAIKDGSEIPDISNDEIDEIFGAIEPSEPSEPGSGETKVVYAKDVLFDNSDTAIVGDNVQSAIVFVSDELNKEVQRAKQTEQNIVSSAVSSTDNSHGVKVTLGGTIGKQQITVETSIGGVNAANSGLVSGNAVHNALVGTSYLATTSSNGIMSKKDKVNINESIKSLSASGTTITYTRADGSTGKITTQDTNTTYVAMKGATSTANGAQGLVPAPRSGNQTKYLRGDGTWQTPKDTTYDAATTSVAGLMSASDKKKLDGIANSANAYALPQATETTLGGVKVGNNITLNNGTISLTKSNVTSALGYTPPTTDTTYGTATSTSNGLMSSQMVVTLNGAAQTGTKISASDAINGVGVTIGGTIGNPTIKVSVNGGTITQNSSSIVSAGDVYSALVNDTYIKAIELDYIDELFK